MKNKTSSINLTISLIIIVGFIVSGMTSLLSFQTLFKKDVEAVSELTSENIYVNINNLMDRPINVSIAMAHDTFLRDFINKEPSKGLGAESLDAMKEYLSSYQQKYQFDSVFFVSTKTGAYYHYEDGLDRIMTPGNPENNWYFTFLEDGTECSLNVDNDEVRNDIITIFVNCKLFDENNKAIGVVGVGLETPYIQQFLLENEKEYGIHAYLIDKSGNIQLSSEWTGFQHRNLFEDEAFLDMAGAIDTNTTGSNQRWYHSSKADGYIITRYVPNLNWYLVVEKSTNEFKEKLMGQLGIVFLSMILVIGIVITITTTVIKRYNYKLIKLAEVDQLTGMRNRTSYERELSKYSPELERYQSFGIGVFDLNQLKVVNDLYGHQTGDEYIKVFSDILCNSFDSCNVFRIGGDEFAVIFLNISEESVLERWEKLSMEIDTYNQKGTFKISAAFGYAFFKTKDLNTVEDIFKKADDNMYLNKVKRRHVNEK